MLRTVYAYGDVLRVISARNIARMTKRGVPRVTTYGIVTVNPRVTTFCLRSSPNLDDTRL